MVLNSDELEILDYLRCRNGEYVAIAEICRRAGGRKKFMENPNWAKTMMNRLVEANLVDANERGHFRFLGKNLSSPQKKKNERPDPGVGREEYSISSHKSGVVDDNYFPAKEAVPEIIDENYFPAPEEPSFGMNQATNTAKADVPTSHIVDENYFPASGEDTKEW